MGMENSKVKYKLIASGSSGNAILYHDSILVDIGVSYKKLAPYLPKIQLVLLTHEHSDHLNIKTLQRLQYEKPSVIVACGSFLIERLAGIKNVYPLEYGKLYNFGSVQVNPVMLYHDVPNYGYRIYFNDSKIFHATDTSTLEGISAKGFDLYAIEGNYLEETLKKQLETSIGFEHGWRSQETHLSEEQRRAFIEENAIGEYEEIRLHVSSKYGE